LLRRIRRDGTATGDRVDQRVVAAHCRDVHRCVVSWEIGIGIAVALDAPRWLVFFAAWRSQVMLIFPGECPYGARASILG
jgi:hypothetical protein